MTRRIILLAILCGLTATSALAGPRLLVVSREDAALEVYDANTYKSLFKVSVPGEPHQVAVSHQGRFAYTADLEGLDNTISIIDLEEHKRVAAIDCAPSYKPHDVMVTRDDAFLYATCEASRAIIEVDLATRKVTRTFKLRDDGVHMFTMSPDEKWIYATSAVNGTISFVNRATGELDRTVMSGQGCEGIAVTPDGQEIWSINRRYQTISVTESDAHKRELTISAVGNPIRVFFTENATNALVSCSMKNEIAIFDRAKREEIGRVAVGYFPIGIALSPDGTRWFVTNGRDNTVSVVDAAARKQIDVIPVGKAPEGILYLE
jgi:YVTN family beta-propeller protein